MLCVSRDVGKRQPNLRLQADELSTTNNNQSAFESRLLEGAEQSKHSSANRKNSCGNPLRLLRGERPTTEPEHEQSERP